MGYIGGIAALIWGLLVLMVPSCGLSEAAECPACGETMKWSTLMWYHPRKCPRTLQGHNQTEDTVMAEAEQPSFFTAPAQQPPPRQQPPPAQQPPPPPDPQPGPPSQPLPQRTQMPALSPEQEFNNEVEMLLLTNLSDPVLRKLFDLFKRCPGQAYKPSAHTVKGVLENITHGKAGPGFTTCDVREVAGLLHTAHPDPYRLIVRDDVEALLAAMVREGPLDRQQWAKRAQEVVVNGVRLINEAWTADKWLDAQEALGSAHPILWINLWSDNTSFDKALRQLGHLVSVSLGNTSIEHQNKTDWDGGQRLLAILPKVKQLPGEQEPRYNERKAAVLQHAMARVLQPFKSLCAKGRVMRVVWPDGSQDDCVVRFMAYLADLQEQTALLGLKSTGTHMPDVQYLIPKEQLADFDTPLNTFPLRTEDLHQEALNAAHSHKRQVAAAGADVLEKLSMKPVPFVALWGFFDNVYASFPPDVLHQCHTGLSRHILQFLDKWLDTHGNKVAINAAINARLAEMRPLHEAFYPAEGLNAPKMCGTEYKGLLQFLAPALYGLVSDEVTQMVADYARYAHLRDATTHTTCPRSAGPTLAGSLAQLDEDIVSVGKAMRVLFEDVDKNPAFPKFFNIRKYPQAILQFGNTRWTNTAPREALIKSLRDCYQHTNKQPATLNTQVAAQVQRREALSSAEQAWERAAGRGRRSDDNDGGSGVRQRANSTNRPALGATLLELDLRQVHTEGTVESSLRAVIPQLEYMQAALQKAFGGADTTRVSIRRCLGLPRLGGADVVHSHAGFFGRTRYSQAAEHVAYRGEARVGGVDVSGTYYAEVIAVGSVPVVGGLHSFVFCRGLASAGTANNVLHMQPLVWERQQLSKRGREEGALAGFMALDVAMLLHKACIIPDFLQGSGHFFVNNLIHEADEHLPKEVNMHAAA